MTAAHRKAGRSNLVTASTPWYQTPVGTRFVFRGAPGTVTGIDESAESPIRVLWEESAARGGFGGPGGLTPEEFGEAVAPHGGQE